VEAPNKGATKDERAPPATSPNANNIQEASTGTPNDKELCADATPRRKPVDQDEQRGAIIRDRDGRPRSKLIRAPALYQSSLQPGAYRNYGSDLSGFFKFCEESSINPLDITNAEIGRYVVWIADQDTVAAVSLQPCLSAINKFLLDHGKPPVALGPLIDGVHKGLANCQRILAPTPERLPLSAPVALAILEMTETLLKVVQWDCPTANNNTLLRARVASIAPNAFLRRGECGACARSEDLVVNTTHVTLRLIKEKGQLHQREIRKNTRQILVDDMPRVARAVGEFFKGMHMMKTRARRWTLTAKEDKSKWTATTSTEWV